MNYQIDLKTPYINKIFNRLKKYTNSISKDIKKWSIENNYGSYDQKHLIELIDQIKYLEERKFSEEDAFQYLINTEEIDPRIPEDIALKRMEKITSKYVDRRR